MADEQTPPKMVRVSLGDDHYQGEYFREDPNGKYEIPQEQLERWKESENAYRAMQDQIGTLLDKATVDRTTEK
jgi:hypothetical protein